MKNKNISLLNSILTPLPLDISKSSARRRFLRYIKGFVEDYNLEGEEIRKKYSDKDTDGAPKSIKNIIQYTLENRKKADIEFDKLINLEIPLNLSEGESTYGFITKDVAVIKQILQTEYDKLFILTDEEKKDGKTEKELNDNVFEFSETLLEIIKELE